MLAQITLTTLNTAYQLQQLLNGTVGTSSNPYPAIGPSVRELTINADAGNGAAKVALIPNVASPLVTKGVQLLAGDSITFRSPQDSTDLITKYLVTDTSGSKVNVMWETV